MIVSTIRSLVQNRDTRWMVAQLARRPHRLRKLRNVLRVQWARLRGDPSAGNSMPLIVSVEPTNACNMKCPMCPTGLDALSRRKGMMDVERFRRLVDELAPTTLIMTFWGWGESTLHPRLYEMIGAAHDAGIFTMLTMNGTSIEPARLIDCGLDYLVVSFDGIREESYGPVRVGGDLESAKAGVRALAAEKRRRGGDLPRVNMGFIVTKLNAAELPDLDHHARALGFDATRPKYLHTITKDVADRLRPDDPALQGEVGIRGPGRQLEKDIPGRPPVPVPNGCGLLWQYSMIYWDGSMVPCCYDWEAEQTFGNAFEHGFRAVWQGPAYRAFRRRVRDEKKSLDLCRECQGGDIMVFFSDNFLLNGKEHRRRPA